MITQKLREYRAICTEKLQHHLNEVRCLREEIRKIDIIKDDGVLWSPLFPEGG